MSAERGPSGTGHDTARGKWSRYDVAHGSRIRMILDGPDKGSWVAWCLDCDWTADDPMPSLAAGEAARKHEDEARHAYEPDPPVAVPGPASVSPAEPRDCPRCGRTYNPEPENDPGVCCICTRDLREEAKHGPGWREKVVSDARSAADPVVSPADTPEEFPERIVVGANGAYWRDYGEFYSMCPVSTDNDPVVIVAVYGRADNLGPDTSAADVDGAEPETLGHHEPVGERQGRQPAQEPPADPSVSPADTRTVLIRRDASHLLRSVVTYGGVKEIIGSDLYRRSLLALRSLEVTPDELLTERAALLAVGERDKAEIEESHAFLAAAQRVALRDRQRIARLTEQVERLLDCRGATNGTVSKRGGEPAVCRECAEAARAVLAGEEDAE